MPEHRYLRVQGIFHPAGCICYPCRYRRAREERERLVWPSLILTDADKKLLKMMKISTEDL